MTKLEINPNGPGYVCPRCKGVTLTYPTRGCACDEVLTVGVAELPPAILTEKDARIVELAFERDDARRLLASVVADLRARRDQRPPYDRDFECVTLEQASEAGARAMLNIVTEHVAHMVEDTPPGPIRPCPRCRSSMPLDGLPCRVCDYLGAPEEHAPDAPPIREGGAPLGVLGPPRRDLAPDPAAEAKSTLRDAIERGEHKERK